MKHVQNISQSSGDFACTKSAGKNKGDIVRTKSVGAQSSNRTSISKSSSDIASTKSVCDNDGKSTNVSKSTDPKKAHKPWSELGTPHRNKSDIASKKIISYKKLTVQNIS